MDDKGGNALYFFDVLIANLKPFYDWLDSTQVVDGVSLLSLIVGTATIVLPLSVVMPNIPQK